MPDFNQSFHLNIHNLSHSRTRLLRAALLLTAVVSLVMLALPAASRAADLIAPRDADRASADTARGQTDDAQNAFEQNARQLAAVGSDRAWQTLIQALGEGEPASHRDTTIQLLKEASPQVVPMLTGALNDPDEGVRAGAAEVLGLRREYQAIAALETATRDPRASVRIQAANSLGRIYAWQDLPRLAELQVNEGNADVRTAARAAEDAIKAQIANEIGALENQVLAVSVTTSDSPRLYAVTRDDLYARRGTTWSRTQPVPDIPLALASGPDANVLYLSTEGSNLYRSADGGETWQRVSFGLNTPARPAITAIAVSPQDSQHVYVALATGTPTQGLDALGVAMSADGGKSWTWLPDAPTPLVTTRLIVDPTAPGYLYGLADDTPWRHALASFNDQSPYLSA